MTQNRFESCLANVGQKLGLGSLILEFLSELGGSIFVIVRLSQMNENKCRFKIAQEVYIQSSEIKNSYYAICEDIELNDISLDQYAKNGIMFINRFSKAYLLTLGIIWILIEIILIMLKCCNNSWKKQKSLKNKKALNCIEGIEFLLTFVISSLMIPISGMNYEIKCVQNDFNIFGEFTIFIYFSTYFFLFVGMLVYCEMINKQYANPIWALFFFPHCLYQCFFEGEDEIKDQTEEEKKQEESLNDGKRICLLIILLFYFTAVFLSFISFFINSHPAIITFYCVKLFNNMFQAFKHELEIQEEENE